MVASSPPAPLGRRAALGGVVATGVALGVGELAAGLLPAGVSPVLAVGAAVIDAVPPQVKDLAIRWFGTADKAVLIGGVLVLSSAFGAGLGLLGARRLLWAAVGFAAFGVVGVLASTGDPRASLAAAAGVAAAAVLAGVVALRALLRAAARHPQRRGDRRPDVGEVASAADRRAFLTTAVSGLAVAAVSATIGRSLFRRAGVATARAALVLPQPTGRAPSPGPAVRVGVEGVTPYVTPNESFYRIDTALSVPRVDVDTWRLRVTGEVERPLELTFDELVDVGLVEHWTTLTCVSNEVGGHLIGNALWRGVPLRRVLDLAGVRAGATQVVGRSVDGWTAGFPTQAAYDGRAAMVAVAMNGEPLPVEHGFPARLVVPGLYGYVSATKWLTEIELTTLEAFDAYWIPRGWAKFGPVKTQSRIDVPRSGATVAAGEVAVAGVAWAQGRGVADVEVQVDDGPWAPARLAGVLNDDTWRQWAWSWQATPGRHLLRVRATDDRGETQTSAVAPPAPDGATGWHTVSVEVA